jgi:hypothetical protein
MITPLQRLALASPALITVAAWWFYARHLEGVWMAMPVGAIVAGGACGVYASWRRWWLPLLPLPAFAASGIALSFAFSDTHALAGDGDWSARAVVAFAGIWYGLVATGVLLVVLAIRAAAYSVEYFG